MYREIIHILYINYVMTAEKADKIRLCEAKLNNTAHPFA